MILHFGFKLLMIFIVDIKLINLESDKLQNKKKILMFLIEEDFH